MAITKINKIPDNLISTAKIADNTVINADINSCAAITQSKLSGLTTSLNNICSATTSAIANNSKNAFNIGLLGFKMAVNESLTVFNLIDGVVDEFNDESGTDEAEGTNDLYCGTSDYYINSTTPDGTPQTLATAGFTTNSITEPDTSVAGTNPAYGEGTFGTFTVPACVSSVNISVWGAAGGAGARAIDERDGGGGGFATGNLAVSPSQILYVSAGEGGGYQNDDTVEAAFFLGGFNNSVGGNACYNAGGGGGLSGVFSEDFTPSPVPDITTAPSPKAPTAYIVAGSGGASSNDQRGGAGGGLTGGAAGPSGLSPTFTSSGNPGGGGGGTQTTGGQGVGTGGTPNPLAGPGLQFYGGPAVSPIARYSGGGGGAGWFGGGGGARTSSPALDMAGGGGSSYYGHPQVSCGSTEAGDQYFGGGTADPNYIPGTNEGIQGASGEDGYVLIQAINSATSTSTTIVSSTFSSTTVPTSSRIVVFEENIDTPTLNTDIIASISRDGTNFSNVTLSDSGYVTGSSGQRVLTGQVDISGQPSGQSMRWKLQLANNQVKIHGVSLSWA